MQRSVHLMTVRSTVFLVLCGASLLLGVGASSARASDSSLDRNFRIAAREGRVGVMKDLLAAGANASSEGAFGETALFYAARYNQQRAAEWLLDEASVSVDSVDSDGRTPLMAAAMNCSRGISAKLLARRPNLNRVDNEGFTALMHASLGGCDEIVRQLVAQSGVDKNVRDFNGRTALEMAATEAQVEVGGPYSRIVDLLGGESLNLRRVAERQGRDEAPSVSIDAASGAVLP